MTKTEANMVAWVILIFCVLITLGVEATIIWATLNGFIDFTVGVLTAVVAWMPPFAGAAVFLYIWEGEYGLRDTDISDSEHGNINGTGAAEVAESERIYEADEVDSGRDGDNSGNV